jgi:hypothetical protein
MGYSVRILGTSDQDINIRDLEKEIREKGLNARIEIDENEQPGKWTL